MPEPRFADSRIADAQPVVIQTGMTAELYFTLAESSQPQNLIDGLLYVSPPPTDQHEDLLLALAEALAAWARERGGKVFVQRPCWLADTTVIEPDVLYLAPGRSHLAGRFVRGAPDLAVEVVSTATAAFDNEAKFAAYGKHGVREARFVDPETRTVTVVSGDGQAWRSERTVDFGEVIPSEMVELGTGNLGRAG